ncbi:MAG: PaaI family thioesterase [Bacteroidales bacterium]|jgi:uncharacterized protein (TIGR00369 family)|nr:PaaI family thioesterase [Bacteroidales bacterium]
MHRKVRNPFDPSGYNCFGCSSGNPAGLKLSFTETDETVEAQWTPDSRYEGYINVLHGGIIATLLDEVAAWFVYVKLGTSGVTSELRVRYLHPVHISKGIINVKASLISQSGRKAIMKCCLYDGESKLCAESETEFFVFPSEVAGRRFFYPGREAFLNDR